MGGTFGGTPRECTADFTVIGPAIAFLIQFFDHIPFRPAEGRMKRKGQREWVAVRKDFRRVAGLGYRS
jgi:hypothetical protein